MSFWDGDARDENTRVLWNWSIQGFLFQNTKPKKDKPMSRRARHGRSRNLAETFEGVSKKHDQEGYGFGQFGGMTTGLFRRKRRAS